MHVASHITSLGATSIDEWIDDTQHYVLIESVSVIQDDVRMILWKASYSQTKCRRQWDLSPGPLGQQASAKPTELPELLHINQ